MKQLLKAAAKRWLQPLMPGWPDEGRRIVQGPHVEALIERVARQNSRIRTAFNAGAGEGGYSPPLRRLPGLITLIESDFSYRFQPPRQADPRQVFFCASLVSIPLASQTVDLVLCTEVLEHIEEHEQALDELVRVLAPGGSLIITVPTPPAIPDPAHVREGYRTEELTEMLKRRGMEVLEVRFCMYFFFRSFLAMWPKLRWSPRLLTWTLSHLDKWIQIGPPMDLMILARLVYQESEPSSLAGQSPASRIKLETPTR